MDAESGVGRPGPARRVGVFIVTPIKLYRDGIAHYLQASDRVEVLGAAEEGATALHRVETLLPDVILLDMALEQSCRAARALRAALPDAGIVALAVPDSEDHVLRCAEAGISGYVSREGSLRELLEAVVAGGLSPCAGHVAAALYRRLADASSADAARQPAPPGLTAREAEIVRLIDNGLSNRQIASELCIEVATVKNHVHSILEKFGARSRGEAAARARGVALSAG